MARKGENIYHRKDGRWEGRYIIGRKLNKKPIFHSIYGKSYSEVKKQLVLLKSELMKEEEPSPILIYGSGTLSDWMEYWLEVLEKPYVKETTYQLYKRNIENHLTPALGTAIISKITRQDVQNAVDVLKTSLSSSTLHSVCRLLKSILDSAVKHRLILRSPYEEIRLPKYKQKAPRVLSASEQRQLEREVIQRGDIRYLVFLYTGIRLGEFCALQYQDIDFVNNVLRISRSIKRVGRKWVIGTPKTENSVREIPLPFFLTKMLWDRMKENNAATGDYIFPDSKGNASNPRTIQKQFAQLMMKLKIFGAHIHTMRHTFSARYLERNPGAYKALAEILGHSSSAITIKCYDNCAQDRKRESMHSVCMIA